MVLPRRFRSRVLAAVLLIGTCILIGAYYGPGDPVLVRVRDPARLWTLLWPATEKCPVRSPAPVSSPRWNTADQYPELDFSVPDNGGMGFWNDVLEKRYRDIRKNWKDLPLEVIVVPHSHTDPGWLRTFEDYHESFVTHILDNMVKFLDENEDFKFIWSEISFFSEWWKTQSQSTRETVKKILHRRQLEFVTAGWVMPDEAVTHYFAVIDQLVEGHQWLKHFVDAVPEHGWSVDVFGHSASYPYILSSSGISKIVIMRVHYAWKKFLALNQSFDFYWEQPFPSPRVLSHMAPSDLYSFKYACGPDPVICLKFDFRRVDREYSESTSDKITDENVELKAGYLLSQYGRFASLFPHNVLLVPLGDDFRYNLKIEWTQQLENYRKLFDFINNKKELNARVRFGTPADYFQEVDRRMQNNTNKPFMSVLGDFLPYADTYANARPSYWTGFYTTRPFYKKLSQELEHWLRTAEILYSLAKTLVSDSSRSIIVKDYSFLISARQKLALFQHHDAVTGTSKEMVMRDYGQKLHSGIIDAMSVASHATQLLLMESATKGKTWTSQIYPDVYRSSFDQPTRKLSISVPNNGRKIILFNSLTVKRTEIVRIKVKSPLVKVVDSNMNDIPFQINPVFQNELSVSSSEFELYFVALLKPLSYSSYTIIKIPESDREILPKTVVSLSLNNDALASHVTSAFTFEKPQSKTVHFDSAKMRATFLHSGELKNIYLKENGLLQALDIDILTYRPWIYRSGAYLFCPESSDATSMRNLTNQFPLLSIIRGPLMSELRIMYNYFLTSSVRMYHFEDAPAGLHLKIISDVAKIPGDQELIMRIKSDVLNEGTFFTDSNGFQMIKRKFVPHLPVQANYYPATTNIFIEDSNVRLNVILPHSHGVTASKGEIEILLDRKNHYDDGRGVGEGIEDSRTFSSVFWILPETHVIRKRSVHLTSDTFQLSSFIQHPPTILVSEYSEMELIKNNLSFLDESWPSDVHLVNLRSLPVKEDYNLPSNDSLMIIYQRNSLSCSSKDFMESFFNNVGKHSPFGQAKVKSAVRTSLTGIHTYSTEDIEFSTSPPPLQTCKITFEAQK